MEAPVETPCSKDGTGLTGFSQGGSVMERQAAQTGINTRASESSRLRQAQQDLSRQAFDLRNKIYEEKVTPAQKAEETNIDKSLSHNYRVMESLLNMGKTMDDPLYMQVQSNNVDLARQKIDLYSKMPSKPAQSADNATMSDIEQHRRMAMEALAKVKNDPEKQRRIREAFKKNTNEDL